MHSPFVTALFTSETFCRSHFSLTDEKYVESGSPLVCVTALTHCAPFTLIRSSTIFEVLTSNQTETYKLKTNDYLRINKLK